jgi:DNA-binding NarL/FixJ family response regulator
MPAVPVIIYTFYKDPFIVKQAYSVGVSAVISKGEPVAVLIANARKSFDRIAA